MFSMCNICVICVSIVDVMNTVLITYKYIKRVYIVCKQHMIYVCICMYVLCK